MKNNIIKIIEAIPTDLEVIPLIEALSEKLGAQFGDTGKNSFQEWDEKNSNYVFVKALIDDEAVGCGALRPISESIAEVKRMYSKYSRKGIGNKILDYLEKKAKELGFRQIWLETRKLNVEACNFYKKTTTR